MKRFFITAAALSLLAASAGPTFAQSWQNDRHDNNRYDRHDNDRRDNDRHDNYRHHDWRKGGRIDRSDWNRGRHVSDWRNHRLNAPPRGYEWREVDGNYVLAAAATGLIASIILANR